MLPNAINQETANPLQDKEIEYKWRLPINFFQGDVIHHPIVRFVAEEGLAIEHANIVIQRDVYVDTADRALANQRYSLRLRWHQQDGTFVLCLKSLALEESNGAFSRDEFEIAITNPLFDRKALRLAMRELWDNTIEPLLKSKHITWDESYKDKGVSYLIEDCIDRFISPKGSAKTKPHKLWNALGTLENCRALKAELADLVFLHMRPPVDEITTLLNRAHINPQTITGLQPMFYTRIQRCFILLEHNGTVMELALDSGHAMAAGRPQGILPISEMELEVKRPNPVTAKAQEDCDHVAARLSLALNNLLTPAQQCQTTGISKAALGWKAVSYGGLAPLPLVAEQHAHNVTKPYGKFQQLRLVP